MDLADIIRNLTEIERALNVEDFPAYTALLDQAGANVRDFLDELGLDVRDRNQAQACLAGVTMAHQLQRQGFTALGLMLALRRYL